MPCLRRFGDEGDSLDRIVDKSVRYSVMGRNNWAKDVGLAMRASVLRLCSGMALDGILLGRGPSETRVARCQGARVVEQRLLSESLTPTPGRMPRLCLRFCQPHISVGIQNTAIPRSASCDETARSAWDYVWKPLALLWAPRPLPPLCSMLLVHILNFFHDWPVGTVREPPSTTLIWSA